MGLNVLFRQVATRLDHQAPTCSHLPSLYTILHIYCIITLYGCVRMAFPSKCELNYVG